MDKGARPIPARPARRDIVRDVGEEIPDSSDSTDEKAEGELLYGRLEGQIQQ